jgi:hypothetical protein
MRQSRKLPEGFAKYVRSIYDPMAEEAKSCFSESGLRDLYSVISLTVDFHNYLETADMHSPNHNDAIYACGSIISGINSFTSVTHTYKVLVGAVDSRIKWDLTSLPTFKKQFTSMYQEFLAEVSFENKCRLLLDLFKLQIAFVGMLYD